MRCCIASLDEAEREGSIESKEGAVLQCKYCGGWLRVEKGMWRWWNREGQKNIFKKIGASYYIKKDLSAFGEGML